MGIAVLNPFTWLGRALSDRTDVEPSTSSDFDLGLPDALAEFARIEHGAADAEERPALALARTNLALTLDVAREQARLVTTMAGPRSVVTDPVPDTRPPPHRQPPYRPAGPQQHHAPLGAGRGLGRGDHRLPPT